jgi:hypothetical protein
MSGYKIPITGFENSYPVIKRPTRSEKQKQYKNMYIGRYYVHKPNRNDQQFRLIKMAKTFNVAVL